MKHILGLCSIIAVILLWSIQPGYTQDAQAEGTFTQFKDIFDGYLKNATAVRLNELDRFVKIESSFELKYSKSFSDHVGMTATTLATYDAVYDVEDEIHVEDEKDYRTSFDIREWFLDITLDQLDLRFGKQQVVWGKTDGFRVLDVVNPLDLKEFMLTDFLDSRISLWMGTLDYYFTTEFSLQGLIIPDLQFTEPAHAGSEYVFAPSAIPPGVVPVINPTREPDECFKNTEYGLKFTGFYKGWDFTLNYLDTWDDDPIVKQSLDITTGVLTVSPEHTRMQIVGGSFANVLWDTVVRGEFAAKIGKYFSVDDITVPDMVVKKTLLSYALALERKIVDISWTVQFLQETILDYEDAISEDQTDTKFTLRGVKDFMNETLDVVLFAVYGANEGEFLIRPSVEYDITDSTKIKVGIDLFEGGDEKSLFGQFDDKDRVYVELKYSF
jgi:hypothetical protein